MYNNVHYKGNTIGHKPSSSVDYEIQCTISKRMEKRKYIKTRYPEDIYLT